MNIHRLDNTNVGDWWSPPGRYFPFKPSQVVDIINSDQIPNDKEIYIVGGGGLGRPFFRDHLERLKRKDREYKLIAWGIGSDIVENKDGIISESSIYGKDLLGDYFDGFDEIGTRVYDEKKGRIWVPCASSMHPAFFHCREKKPTKKIGVFFHKRVPIDFNLDQQDFLSNDGFNLEEKLDFMSQYEFILTNTYHGVFWATLLNRKVLCMPFKSGLFSFKHKPHYLINFPTNEDYSKAVNYENSLEECRLANINYYSFLSNKYNVI
jgi:hypothetical protein